MAFNKREYDNNYDKEHYSQFKAKLNKDEKKEIDDFLEKNNLTKREFIRKSYKIMKEELKMKEVKWEDLGLYFKKEAEPYLGCWCSDDTNDYKDDFGSEPDYDEKENLYTIKVEITKIGKEPLILEFYQRDDLDENDNVIDTHYYLPNYAYKKIEKELEK